MTEVPLAPVFEPTEEEFRLGPLIYIDKIRPIAEHFGVVKIKPPASWQPPFAIDPEKFNFTPRIQRLHELEGRSRLRLNFAESILKFWRLQGVTVKLPVIEGRSVDLYDLHKTVRDAGGFELLSLHKRWAGVAAQLGLKKPQGAALRNHYERLLLPYDIHQSGLAVEHTNKSPTKQNSPVKPVDGCAKRQMGRRSRYQAAQEFPQVSPTVDMNSTKELRRLQFYGAGPKLAGMPEFLSGDREDIREALSGGVKSTDAAEESEGPSEELDGSVDDSETSSVASDSNRKSRWKNRRAALATARCKICESGEKESRLLCCDGCDLHFHSFCLLPPMTSLPRGAWRCPKCVTDEVSKPQDPYGFDEGIHTYSLQSFGEMADQFKTDYFHQPCHNVPSDQVAKEFWRLVNSESEHFSVEYGADLFTNEVGSGFPKVTDVSLSPDHEVYSLAPWNLNNLPVLKNSVLRHIATDISGMKIPWVYVGMCFSTFCWHTEDHWSYSINYLHWGEKKIWYGVGGPEADKFETAMKEIVPELFSAQPDLLHHLVTIMNPMVLMEKGVKINRVEQGAGEFVITFPRAYHAGYNEGYNFAEAVNFCPADWLPLGRRCIDAYADVKRLNVFSHDEVCCKMASSAMELDVTLATAAYKDMKVMAERERDLRREMMEMGVKSAEKVPFELLHDDERLCVVCRTTCFNSAISCPCSPKKLVCLRHAQKLCQCDKSKLCLKYRYSLEEIQQMMSALKVRAESFDSWFDRVKCAMNKPVGQKLSLNDLRRLVDDAKEQKISSCDALDWLVSSIKHAERCIGIADQLVAHKIKTRKQSGVVNFSSKLLMDEVVAFYQTILKLPCAIPQAESIKKFIETVKEFRAKSTELLASVPQCPIAGPLVAQLDELFDQGVSLDLQLPEIPQLKEELDRTRWLLKVELATGALNCLNSPPSTSVEVKCEGVKVEDDEEIQFVPNQPSLSTLRQLMLDGVSIPNNQRVETAMAQLQRLLTQAEQEEDKPRLLQSLRQSRSQAGRGRDSLVDNKPVKQSPGRKKRPASEVTSAEGVRKSSKAEEVEESDGEDIGEEDADTICPCETGCLRPARDIAWIQCEGNCQAWLHQICEGISAEEAKQISKYICKACFHHGSYPQQNM